MNRKTRLVDRWSNLDSSHAHKPKLPKGFNLPETINGWVHDPKSNKNGHTWYSPDKSAAVGVFRTLGDVYVKAFDERVTGFGRGHYIYRIGDWEDNTDKESETAWEFAPEPQSENESVEQTTAKAVEKAIEWMKLNDPEWEHSAVKDAAFDPPAGYSLDRYYLEQRNHTVYYRREDAEGGTNISRGDEHILDRDPAVETRPYLVIKTWRGSGNSTITLAPWLRAHDHKMHEVLTPPEECGLDVALKLAREYIADVTGQTRDEPASGQADLQQWS